MKASPVQQASASRSAASCKPTALPIRPRRHASMTVRASAQAPSPQEVSLSRRATLALGSSALLALAAPMMPQIPAAMAKDGIDNVDWTALRGDIVQLISDSSIPGGIGEKGPTLVRLAWHSSGTYDKMTKTGGSGAGTIRFKEELAHGGNAGLVNAVNWLEPLKAKYPGVSYADLYTYAGAVSVEAMGGPKIPFRAGRVDALDPSAVTPDGRLPSPDEGAPPKTAAALRATFGRMGFDDREIVALSGAHALGRCHADYSGYVGPWTPTPEFFSNLYFKLLLKVEWTPDERYPLFQYKDTTGSLMMLPSDIVLIQDEGFKQYVELYAKEKKTFFKDFTAAFVKLEELGTKNLVAIA